MPISLNAPVPGQVERLASGLEPDLYTFEHVRRSHTLGIKRLGERTQTEYARLVPRVRESIAGTPPFEARVAGIETFEAPARGDSPVVYFAVESPVLHELNARLSEAFGAIEGIDSEDYVPHVTLARGGSKEERERLRVREFEPVSWVVNELVLWDAAYEEVATRFSLPV